jgi:hypothetical protein
MQLEFGPQADDEMIPAASNHEGRSESAKNFGGRVKEGKTEITVESYEVLLIKQRGGLSRNWCRSC